MCKLHAQRTDFHRNFTQHFKRKFPNESQCIETKENILTFEYNNVHNVESSMPILYWIQNICWNATMNSKVNFSVNWCLYFFLWFLWHFLQCFFFSLFFLRLSHSQCSIKYVINSWQSIRKCISIFRFYCCSTDNSYTFILSLFIFAIIWTFLLFTMDKLNRLLNGGENYNCFVRV